MLKSRSGVLPGPRGGAEARVRREAPNGGRSGAPRARRCAQRRFSILPSHREKNVLLLSTEVRATQQNPRYSAKNNVAMRVIATFMPILSTLFMKPIQLNYNTTLRKKLSSISLNMLDAFRRKRMSVILLLINKS